MATDDAATAAPLPFELGPQLAKRYAQLAAKVSTIETDLAATIAPLRATADKKAAPIVAELETITSQAEAWWALHGETVTKGKKKSGEVGACVMGMRAGSKRLVIPGDDEAAAIEALTKGRFFTLVKRIFQLDKKAITARVEAEPDGAIAKLGFSIAQTPKFFIEPATHTGRKA